MDVYTDLTSSDLLPRPCTTTLALRATCSRSIEPLLQSTRGCRRSSVRTWPQWNYPSMHFPQCRCTRPCGQRSVKRSLTPYQEIASTHFRLTSRLNERGWCSEWRNSESCISTRTLCAIRCQARWNISCTKTRRLLQGFSSCICLSSPSSCLSCRCPAQAHPPRHRAWSFPSYRRGDRRHGNFAQRLHEVACAQASMTQYAFGVEGGDAGKEACASLTAAVTNTFWCDQRTRSREILLTTLVRGHAIDPIQRAALSVDRDGQKCAVEARTMEGCVSF